LSHLHLDHIGLLSTVSSSTTIILPDKDVAKATIGTWYERSPRWLAYVLPRSWDVTRSAKVMSEDENSVTALLVSHSAYPSVAYLYIGKTSTIFYSGDFRLQRLAEPVSSLEESLGRLGIDTVDLAIVEGTNMGSTASMMTKTGFEETLINSTSTFEGIIVSIDPLDLEAALFLYSVVEQSQRDVVVASERIFWVLKLFHEKWPRLLNKTLVAIETSRRTPPVPISSISLVNEVFRDIKRYIIIAEPTQLLEHLRRLKVQGREVDLSNTVALLLDPEPREVVREIEEEVLIRWLKMFGVHTQRVCLSGHYHPYDFKKIIQLIKPKQLLPIHTEDPDLMLKLFEKLKAHEAK